LKNINGKEIVEKRHVLNELIKTGMTLQEMRFLAIYLAKINARDISTRVFSLPINDFRAIMGFGRINVTQIKKTSDNLLCKLIHIPDGNGGYEAFQLFKKCKVSKENSSYYISFDAHDDAVKLIFDFKEKYVKYELWNVLSLKSANHFRMYEILKQYEKIGVKKFTVSELRRLLGISPDTHARDFSTFRQKVIDSSKNALEKYTDISFTYSTETASNVTRPVTSGVIFNIFKNEPKSKTIYDDFVKSKTAILPGIIADEQQLYFAEFENDRLGFLAEACDHEFNENQMEAIFNLLVEIIPCHLPTHKHTDIEMERYHYLRRAYTEFNCKADAKDKNGSPVLNRFAYFLPILKGNIAADS